MSYCRFSATSDVYVFAHIGGYLCCCGCRLGGNWRYDTTDAIIAHLREHIAAEHRVPDDVIPALGADRDAPSALGAVES